LERYKQGKITVGCFNTAVFSMVKADRDTLIDFVRHYAKIRPGFKDLVDYCKKNGFEFAIISNGLDFYIDFILTGLGMNHLKVIAAATEFSPTGMKVKYTGPDGKVLLDKFKEAYTKFYADSGYRVVYIGNGMSDLPSAQLSYRVFAREELQDCCQQVNLECVPFNDLNDVINGLKNI
jgi:2-hydroxy-3-keto-5-methylthiopentenyl-1-phosphate phosphatase